MFNLDELVLNDSLVKKQQKNLLESQLHDSELRKSNRFAVLEGLAQQYKHIGELIVSGVFSKQRLTESATIHAVKDVIYSIFEGALVLDDDVKAYDADVLREVFDAEFGKLLTENSIVTLTDFKRHYGKSSKMLEAVLETATTLTKNNAMVYNELLENHYGDPEIKKSLLEAFTVLAEADASNEKKVTALEATAKSLKEKLLGADVNGIIKYGVDVKRLVAMLIPLILAVGAVITMGAAIGTVLSVISLFISVGYSLILDVYQSMHANQYRTEIIEIKSELLKLIKKIPATDKQHAKIQNELTRCDDIINKLTTKIASSQNNKKSKKSITEAALDATLSLLTEDSGEVAYEATSDNVNNFCSTLKSAVPDLNGEDTDSLLTSIVPKDVVTESGKLNTGKLLKIACVLYEATINNKPIKFLSEAAHKKLQEGELPDEDQFLDPEEKDLLNTVSSINGKDAAIDTIKNKVIDVIEDEEVRVKEKEAEEQNVLNRMTPDDLDATKATINESVGFRLGSSRLNIPENLFESIVMSRSKKYLQESTAAGEQVDLVANKETILSESIVLYTLHETFNTLNLRKYTPEVTHKFMNDYYYNKI